MLAELSLPVVLALLGVLPLLFAVRSLTVTERRYVFALFAAHVVGAFVQVWVFENYYGYGDMQGIILYGRLVAQALSTDFERFLPEALKMALHLDNAIPLEMARGGGSTGTMVALAGLIIFVVGPSPTGVCMVASIFSLLGQLACYKVAREVVHETERLSVLLGTLFVPSVVFWSSGIQKEALSVGFLGVLCWGVFALTRRHFVRGIAAVIVGAVGVGIIKPYILFPFVLAVGAWLFTVRSGAKRWTAAGVAYGLLATLAAVGGIYFLGQIFPQFSLEGVGETAAHLQGAGEGMRTENDSTFSIGDASEVSLSGQAQFIPLGLVNSLFRPTLAEVRGPVILTAALEMTVVTVMLVVVLLRMRRQAVRDVIRTSPIIVFCAVFVIAFGAGVGLATTNMGTLSRYRMPMMPFYASALLLGLRQSRAVLSTKRTRLISNHDAART